MDLYLFSLVLGATGLVAMAFAGMVGQGHHDGHSGHASTGHGVTHSDHGGADAPRSAVSFLSPRTLFSVLVGFGAVGIAARPYLPDLVVVAAAIVGGVAFEAFLVRPVWNFIFRFGSNPAQTLGSVLFDEARAATAFDASGHGLISIHLDGEVRQLLGVLRPQDRTDGVKVRAGDRLLVEEVDLARGRCVVSWIGS